MAADVGRYDVKMCSGVEVVTFPSRVGEWQRREIASGGNYEVLVAGKKYFVGELAQRESFFVRRTVDSDKANWDLLVKLLCGVYVLAGDGEEIYLVSALPINCYNAKSREKMRNLLGGVHQVSVNGGAVKQLCINNVDITFEGAGVYIDLIMDDGMDSPAECPWLQGSDVHLVDIGSRTVNLLTIGNGQYISRSSRTDDQHGTLLLENASGGRISDQHKMEFAKCIKDLIEMNWCGVEYGGGGPFLVFAGGGALLIEEYLRDYYPDALFPADPVTSQVRGMFKMGLQRAAKGCGGSEA